jgi:anti-sigma factor RsiW
MMEERDLLLLRALAGELDPSQGGELREELDRDPSLRARHRRLEEVWKGLRPPASSPVPPFFAAQVAARVEGDTAMIWRRAPRWARAGAAVALLAGVLLGAGAGLEGGRLEARPSLDADTSALAEEYWELLVAWGDDLGRGGP